MEDEVILKTSQEITDVVRIILNPCSDAASRTTAHQMLDNFRDNSPLCAKIGLHLVKCNEPQLCHFGFQLVDHYIKLHWNHISLEEKIWLKDQVMLIVAQGTDSLLKQPIYLKDALSRIVVELIKREYPQQWPTLFEEFDKLCIIGNTQTELILLINLRLVEDVVHLQNTPDKRRKDIRKALNMQIDKVVKFFWHTVEINYERLVKCRQIDPNSIEAMESYRLIDVALEAISEFIPIIPLKDFISEIGFTKMCVLLGDKSSLRNRAALCLLNILEAQATPNDRLQLRILFNEDLLFQLTIDFLNSELDVCDEQQHFYLKILCCIFTALSQNLSSNVARQASLDIPANFKTFIDCIQLFIQHPSKASLHGEIMLSNILKDSNLSESDIFTEAIPSILKLQIEKLIKVESFTTDKILKFKFYLEADDEEDLFNLFVDVRKFVCENWKEITKLQPKITFSCLKTMVELLLSGQHLGSVMNTGEGAIGHIVHWQTVVAYIVPVSDTLKKLVHSGNRVDCLNELSVEGLELMKRLLDFSPENPTVLSLALSLISNLFFFITITNCDLSSKVLEKIFSNLTSFVNKNSPEVVNLRRHCLALIIKLSIQFPQTLFPHFIYIYEHIQKLSVNILEHSLNKVTLAEIIVILSKEFKDFDKQLYFIQEILEPVSSLWMSDDLQAGISSVDNFILVLGINTPFNLNSEEKHLSKTVCDLKTCLNVFYATLKRSSYPSDPEVAKKGNFIHPHSQSLDNVFYRNPAAQCIMSKLTGIFQFIKISNSLFDPVNQSKIHPTFLSVLDAENCDRPPGIDIPKEKSRLHTIKHCLLEMYNLSISILGCCAESCTVDFYLTPSLQSLLQERLFYGIQHVPELRIKHLIRAFLQPFFIHCPENSNLELMYILTEFFRFMYQKLKDAWDTFKLKYGNSEDYANQQSETGEIYEVEVNRVLSRVYMDFIGDLLTKSGKAPISDDMEDDTKPTYVPISKKDLTPLGNAIFDSEKTLHIVICTAFESLHWPDTALNLKSIMICDLLFKQLLNKQLIRSMQEVTFILHSFLYGIQELGQHEANRSALINLGANFYEQLKPTFPEIRQVVLETTKCEPNCLNELDDLFKKPKTLKRDKQVKEAFKGTIEKIIGVDVGQKHRLNVTIKNLDPFINLSRRKYVSIFDANNEDIGLCDLFSPDRS